MSSVRPTAYSGRGDYEQTPRLRLADGIDPAQMKWPDIGYAECGMGRMDREQAPELLDLHRKIIAVS